MIDDIKTEVIQPHSIFPLRLSYRMCSSDKGEQGATHGQQDQAAVQVQHRRRRPADAQPQLGNTHTHTHIVREVAEMIQWM